MQIQTKVRVGYIRIVNCSAIFIAHDNGYFRQEGLEVELIPLVGGEKIMTALRESKVEIGFSNVASTIFGFDDGAKFVSISPDRRGTLRRLLSPPPAGG